MKSLESETFIRMVISKRRKKSASLKSVVCKLVQLKEGKKVSCVYRHETHDITKNFSHNEFAKEAESLLGFDFMQADLFTAENDWHLMVNKKFKTRLSKKNASMKLRDEAPHDKKKKRLIEAKGNVYLQALGVTAADGTVKKDKQHKYRQINKYVEIIDGFIKHVPFKEPFTVVDMGAGKGYLTFALYDYLQNILGKKAKLKGVELRGELVDKCNRIAGEAGFSRLQFVQGTIQDAELPEMDVVIALHACDTATDDAIFRGLKAESRVIVCAPCCHKHLRKQLCPENALSEISQFGILKERQAELLTDGIRALLLEAYGYKTKVFEFITTDHTPKNVMLVAVRDEMKKEIPDQNILAKIEEIKAIHGIKEHYLEGLVKEL